MSSDVLLWVSSLRVTVKCEVVLHQPWLNFTEGNNILKSLTEEFFSWKLCNVPVNSFYSVRMWKQGGCNLQKDIFPGTLKVAV